VQAVPAFHTAATASATHLPAQQPVPAAPASVIAGLAVALCLGLHVRQGFVRAREARLLG
jgi:hypothetical protein